MEQPHVVEDTSTGGGWGFARVNGGLSNSECQWFGIDPMSKSVNVLTACPLGHGLNAGFTSSHVSSESGESQVPPLMGSALAAETREETTQEDVHTGEYLTIKTEVPGVGDATTAGVTTAARDPPAGGGVGEGEFEIFEDLEWGIPVKVKKKKGGTRVGTPITADPWGTAALGGKKKKKRKMVSAAAGVIPAPNVELEVTAVPGNI